MTRKHSTKPLTKFDVSITFTGGNWVVAVRNKTDSRWAMYKQAEERWVELTARLPVCRG